MYNRTTVLAEQGEYRVERRRTLALMDVYYLVWRDREVKINMTSLKKARIIQQTVKRGWVVDWPSLLRAYKEEL